MDLRPLNVASMKDSNPFVLRKGKIWEDYGIIHQRADQEREISTTGKNYVGLVEILYLNLQIIEPKMPVLISHFRCAKFQKLMFVVNNSIFFFQLCYKYQ